MATIPVWPARLLARNVLSYIIGIVTVLALAAGALLLFCDVFGSAIPWLAHAPISAAPLILIGAASLGFILLIRPQLLDLVKALIVSAAFILWGIDQLLPAGWAATTLGDLVISLYVIDLGWMLLSNLREQQKRRQS